MQATTDDNEPRRVIESIRDEYLVDIDEESDRVKRGARSLQKQLNRAVELLSQDLYSKKSHFILELIQNADDNEYPENVVPQLTFRLSPQRLVLQNNEIGFSARNVQALCRVGDSSKEKKSGYIGEKGIGFKSVFTVSNAPEIHSNGYHFRFDRSDDTNLLGYVVPEWCEPAAEALPGTTAIVLPAADGYEFSAAALECLDARLLLFLSKLRQIELLNGKEKTVFSRRDLRGSGISVLTTENERSGASARIEEDNFVRVSINVSLLNALDDKRQDISESSVVLALPVDPSGAAKPQVGSQVFAFLPIRQVGFKFSIHADFILSSSREDILTDRAWNRLLRDSIADAFASAVDTFRGSGPLAFTYLKYLPTEGEISDPFFRPLTDSIIERLGRTECLPSEGGQWKRPGDLRLAEPTFRELFPPKTAMELLGFDYVDRRTEGGEDLLLRLGVRQVSVADIVGVFERHGDWLTKQPLEWKARFYAMLAELDLKKLVPGLLAVPCIPTNNGQLVIPSQTQVFFPLSRGKKYGFEHELVIVDSDLLDQAQALSERVQALFTALRVKSDDPYDLVTSHILPMHEGESWRSCANEAIVGHLRYIKDKLQRYVQGATSAGKSEGQAWQTLRDGIWVGTKQRGEHWIVAKAQRLYLSKEYAPSFCIETLLGDAIAPSLLVSPDYLAIKPKDPESEAESWRTFLVHLGVCVAPRLERSHDGNIHCSAELQLLLGSPNSSVRKAVLECVDSQWDFYSRHLSYDVRIRRYSVTHATQFASSLRAMLAPTRKRVSPRLSEVFYPTAELRALFGDRVTYIDATLRPELLDACGVIHRLDATTCLKRLRQLKAEGGDTTPQLHALYRHLEQFWDKEGPAIRRAFSQEGLIRLKGTNAIWAMPTEVAWRSNGTFLDSLYPPLEGQYKDFSGFFNEKLGIPKQLPTEKWIDALGKLEDLESIDERRREALAIYKRANRDLSPRFGRDEVPEPDWLRAFEVNAYFLNHRGELVSSDDQLFANDDPELAALFSDAAEASFLAVPPEEVSRIDRLLTATSVRRLSASVSVQVVESPGSIPNRKLTDQIRQAAPSIGRVMYARSHDIFERALEQGKFSKLREIQVIEVADLKVSVTLAQVSRVAAADIALSDGRVYVKTGAKAIKDQLAGELCKLLDAPLDLADTFARLLMEEEQGGADDFLRVRRIAQLPADLLQKFDHDGAQQLLRDQPVEGQESVDRDLEGSFDEVTATDGDDATRQKSSATDDRKDNASLAPTSVGHAVETDSTMSGPTGSQEPAVVSPTSAAQGSPAAAESDSARQGSNIATPGRSSPMEPNVAGGRTGAHTTPRGDTQGSSSADGVPSTDIAKLIDGKQGGSRERAPNSASSARGRGRRRRAKSGRLMSHASPTGDADVSSGNEDPAKAAARVALGKAAVEYFLATQASRWKSLTPMPHNNPGFDVKAIAHDGAEEYIEVKGQGAAWTEDGVALTPTELMHARKHGQRYWLCVVEHVQDDKRRSLYLLQNPYGLTQQFRFDSGWKSAALNLTAAPINPDVGLFVEIPQVGRGRILSFKKANQFYKLHLMLGDGRQVHKVFNPATMRLSTD